MNDRDNRLMTVLVDLLEYARKDDEMSKADGILEEDKHGFVYGRVCEALGVLKETEPPGRMRCFVELANGDLVLVRHPQRNTTASICLDVDVLDTTRRDPPLNMRPGYIWKKEDQ